MGIDIRKILNIVGTHVSNNKVNYLTAAGIAFEVAALALTFKHAPKCMEIIERNAEHEKIRGEELTTREKYEPLVKELCGPAMCAAVSFACQIGACKVSNKAMKAFKIMETAYSGVSTAYMLQKKEIEKLPEEQRKEIEKNVAEAEKALKTEREAVVVQNKSYIQKTGQGDELIEDVHTGQMWYGSRGFCLECVDAMKKTLRRGKEDEYTHNELLADIGVRSATTAGDLIIYKAHNDDDYINVSFEKMDGGDHPWYRMTIRGYEIEAGTYYG